MAATSRKESQRRRKYYVRSEIAPFEEDMTHEFKGHRNMCHEELPRISRETKYTKASRKAVSRNLCGFLNTGLGGTVYCGIHDDGKIGGLTLTQYQCDHTTAAMKDLMSRYDPQVPPQRYKVRFVPSLSPLTKAEERNDLAEQFTKKFSEEDADPFRKRPHLLRSAAYCWCDFDALARLENGIIVDSCIIELSIKPWNADDKAVQGVGVGDTFNVYPVHAEENGKVYFRRNALLVQYTPHEIANIARFEAKNRGDIIVNRLKKEIELVRSQLAKVETEDSESPTPRTVSSVSQDRIASFSPSSTSLLSTSS